MRNVVLALLLVATALAGCSDQSKADGGPDGHATHGDGLRAEAPVWALGDFWSFEDSANNTFTVVVAEDNGADWEMLPDSPYLASVDWMIDISYMGPMRKSDLAGQQGTSRIQFFDFPLEHDKSWMTTWDGANRHIVAHAMEDGRFHIVSHVSGDEMGDEHAIYIYNPEVGFFDEMTFFDADTGEVAYEATRTDAGSVFTGEVYRYTGESQLLSISTNGPGTLAQGTFTIGDEHDIVINIHMDCNGGQGEVLAAVDTPNDDGSVNQIPPLPFVREPEYGAIIDCPGDNNETFTFVVPAVQGTWRGDGLVAASAGIIEITATARTMDTLTL